MQERRAEESAAYWFDNGKAYYDTGDYDEAIRCNDEALRLNPQLTIAWYNKGAAYCGKGNYDEAIQCYDEALKLDPQYAIAWCNKGAAYYGKDNYDEAMRCNSHGMQNNTAKFVALLNRLWDGKPFTAHRKTSKNLTVTNRRLTVSLMMQPLILQQMLAKNNGVNRQSGFMARSLMAFPDSAMGERFYQEPPDSQTALSSFHQRIIDCLNESLTLDKDGCHELPTLRFSDQAKATWVSFFNEIEANLSDKWSCIKDFASKAAENTARLSALLHLFSGKKGQINCEETEQAIEIIRWHLCETRRIFFSKPRSSQHADAIKLLEWIREKGFTTTTPRFGSTIQSPSRETKKRQSDSNAHRPSLSR